MFLSNEINFDQNINCFYLLYDEKKLVSFLSLFIPMRNEAEISAYTLPEFRNKGYFHLLFQKAIAELQKYDIIKVLFVHEPSSESAKPVLHSLGAKDAYSEYLLVYHPDTAQKADHRLRLELAKQSDLPEMAALDCSVFDDSYDEALSILSKSLGSPKTKVYCAFLKDKVIGSCTANMEGSNVCIFGLGISPEYQNKGYGREMLNLLLGQLTQHKSGEISLEVSSTNAAAYHLYITSGFHPKTQYDYAVKHIINHEAESHSI